MRRQRNDNTESGIAAFKAARDPMVWPAETVDRMSRAEDQERAEVIFRAIMTSRAPADFRQHDHVLAAQLAVVEVDIAKLQAQIDLEGYTVAGGKNGTATVKHPALDPQQFLVNRQIQLARALGLVGVGIDLRTVKNGAKLVNDARETIGGMKADSLLAGYDDGDDFSVGRHAAR